jgi:hypothetical protein
MGERSGTPSSIGSGFSICFSLLFVEAGPLSAFFEWPSAFIFDCLPFLQQIDPEQSLKGLRSLGLDLQSFLDTSDKVVLTEWLV